MSLCAILPLRVNCLILQEGTRACQNATVAATGSNKKAPAEPEPQLIIHQQHTSAASHAKNCYIILRAMHDMSERRCLPSTQLHMYLQHMLPCQIEGIVFGSKANGRSVDCHTGESLSMQRKQRLFVLCILTAIYALRVELCLATVNLAYPKTSNAF